MGELKIKNVVFGNGVPKVCVPIVGRTKEEIIRQAKYIKKEADNLECLYQSPDLAVHVIEFRADYYDEICDSISLNALLRELRDIFPQRLILFTYRSEEEGGELRHDRAENMLDDIYEWVIASGYVDIIDVELLSGNYRVVRKTTKAHDKGIKVIISNHDFEKTPRDDEIIERLKNMEILGGDILKCAYMPRTEFDVRRLMELTQKITENKLFEMRISQPIVTMSMGKLGQISRVSGKKTGSALTFGAVGSESAPGQYNLSELFNELSKR